MRNPDWSRDETILLMNLYLSVPRAGKAHPEVAALSELLRQGAEQSGLRIQPTYRNSVGIAMRLRNFGRHDPEAPPGRDAGLRPGGAIDAAVWREFGGDRSRLADEVRRIQIAIARGFRDTWEAPSSHGPLPAFGPRTTIVDDGPTTVYLLLIDAPLELLVPSVIESPGHALIKIGRTSNLARRIAELSAGLPPMAAVHYVPISLRQFEAAGPAHEFERMLLDRCDERGWSLGGEFAYAPLVEMREAFSGVAHSLT